MSTERDELEAVADTVLFTDSYYGDMFREGKGRGALIDAILAAGYRKPRTITTVEELDALPDTAAILTRGGIVFRKYDNWFSENETAWIRCGVGHDPLTTAGFSYDAWAHFPAVVLHEGEANV